MKKVLSLLSVLTILLTPMGAFAAKDDMIPGHQNGMVYSVDLEKIKADIKAEKKRDAKILYIDKLPDNGQTKHFYKTNEEIIQMLPDGSPGFFAEEDLEGKSVTITIEQLKNHDLIIGKTMAIKNIRLIGKSPNKAPIYAFDMVNLQTGTAPSDMDKNGKLADSILIESFHNTGKEKRYPEAGVSVPVFKGYDRFVARDGMIVGKWYTVILGSSKDIGEGVYMDGLQKIQLGTHSENIVRQGVKVHVPDKNVATQLVIDFTKKVVQKK